MENQEKTDRNSQSAAENELPETAQKKPPKQPRLYGLKIIVLVAFVAFGAAIAGLALLTNIMERKNEARNPFFRVVELTDDTIDLEIWGKNFPLQYDGYKRTVDQQRTRYGGSEAEPLISYFCLFTFAIRLCSSARRHCFDENFVGDWRMRGSFGCDRGTIKIDEPLALVSFFSPARETAAGKHIAQRNRVERMFFELFDDENRTRRVLND